MREVHRRVEAVGYIYFHNITAWGQRSVASVQPVGIPAFLTGLMGVEIGFFHTRSQGVHTYTHTDKMNMTRSCLLTRLQVPGIEIIPFRLWGREWHTCSHGAKGTVLPFGILPEGQGSLRNVLLEGKIWVCLWFFGISLWVPWRDTMCRPHNMY